MKSFTKACVATAIVGGLAITAPIASADSGSSMSAGTQSAAPVTGSGILDTGLSFLCVAAASATGSAGLTALVPNC